MREKLKEIISYLIYFSLFLYFAMIVSCIVLLTYPYKTVDFYNFKITEIRLRPEGLGYIVTSNWSFMKYVDAPTRYTVEIVQDDDVKSVNISYNIESGTSNLNKGFHRTSKSVKVSEEIEPGSYRVKATLVYRVNFLREVKKRIYYRKLFCR
jgi:hypothetical protein